MMKSILALMACADALEDGFQLAILASEWRFTITCSHTVQSKSNCLYPRKLGLIGRQTNSLF